MTLVQKLQPEFNELRKGYNMEILIGLIIGLILGFFGAFHIVVQELEEMTEEDLLETNRVLRSLKNSQSG